MGRVGHTVHATSAIPPKASHKRTWLMSLKGQQRTRVEIKSLLPLMHDFLSAAILSPPVTLVAHASR